MDKTQNTPNEMSPPNQLLYSILSVASLDLHSQYKDMYEKKEMKEEVKELFTSKEEIKLFSISDLKLEDPLGEGNFGTVYRAVWEGTTTIAVKKLKREESSEAILSEARILK